MHSLAEPSMPGPSGKNASRMTPLDAYLHSRMGKSVTQRLAWDRRTRALPDCLGGFVRHKLWKWPYRHMRSIPPGVELSQAGPGAWTISTGDRSAVTTVPLAEWLGPIDRPVTIVAGGPSAREHCFNGLRSGERLIVAVNGVPAFLAEMGLRPDAWIVSDTRLASQISNNFPYAVGTPLATTANVAASLTIGCPQEISGRPLCIIERANQWHGLRSLDSRRLLEMNSLSGEPFVFPSSGVMKSIVGWSRRPELGFFSGCTVVFASLQILIGLGAKDVEIIGMDLSDQGHAYAEGEDALPSSLSMNYQQNILPSFKLMHQALTGTGVRLRNLSPVCPLPQEIFAC